MVAVMRGRFASKRGYPPTRLLRLGLVLFVVGLLFHAIGMYAVGDRGFAAGFLDGLGIGLLLVAVVIETAAIVWKRRQG